mgnify:FL=1
MPFQSAHQKGSIENRKSQFPLDTLIITISNDYTLYREHQSISQTTYDILEPCRYPDISELSSTSIVDTITLSRRHHPKISDGMTSMTTLIKGAWCSSLRVESCHTQYGSQYKHVNTCTVKPPTITIGLLCKWYSLKNS